MFNDIYPTFILSVRCTQLLGTIIMFIMSVSDDGRGRAIVGGDAARHDN